MAILPNVEKSEKIKINEKLIWSPGQAYIPGGESQDRGF
jgi:hypothetical protein